MSEALATCPACGSGRLGPLLRQPEVPANSCIVLDSPQAARDFPRGELELTLCRECELIFNRRFDASLTEYSARYEETQAWSPTFRAFHAELADALIARYGLAGRTVVEIGCGKGEFLHLLAERAGVHGIGYDPSFRADRLAPPARGSVRAVTENFPHGPWPEGCALVCCKMTLEHVARPHALLAALRRALGTSSTGVFFMVPDAERIVRRAAFEDLYYEHCNYFTRHALLRLFERTGFAVAEATTVFDGQYLCVHARPGSPPLPALAVERLPPRLLEGLRPRILAARQQWITRIEAWAQAGQRIVLWGSGSKSLAFVTLTGCTERIEALVDINPQRQGSWQPGTALPIVSPAALAAVRPGVVIAMNAAYRDEIARALAELGWQGDLVTL